MKKPPNAKRNGKQKFKNLTHTSSFKRYVEDEELRVCWKKNLEA